MKKQDSRKNLQRLTWLGLPLSLAVGWVYPLAGFLLFGCMIGAVALAFRRGRNWCDWMCPRGAFYDLFFAEASPKRRIPSFLRRAAVRMVVLATVFTSLGIQFYRHWGDPSAIGHSLVRVLTLTTLVGMLFALLFHPRAWCHVCPMGTVAHWIAEGRKPLRIAEGCTTCGVCSRTCPMQLAPHAYREEGTMGDNDCLKCGLCVDRCPKKVLSFDPPVPEARYRPEGIGEDLRLRA